MLDKLIKKDTYQYLEGAINWKEAIEIAAKPLLDKNTITKNYVNKMIQNVEEYGPFIDLGKNIAIPHARPEYGVNETGMSILRVKKPVYLLDDPAHAIKTFIVIAAKDNNEHLGALKRLTEILTVDEQVDRLNQSTNFSDIEKLLKEETGEED